MQTLEKGCYRARPAENAADVARAHLLRRRCFGTTQECDEDHLDDLCVHMLIEDIPTGTLLGCFRMVELQGHEMQRSYAAQYYDLEALSCMAGPMLEMGRFCVDPVRIDPNVLRLAWAVLTQHVDRKGVKLLFGCSSFKGNEPSKYSAAFSLLNAHHLAPKRKAPLAKATETYHFAKSGSDVPERGEALKQMPPLLRGYLSMGAWVSDHAVIDRGLNTLHVFTGLEVDAIPTRRKSLLRDLTGQSGATG